MFSDELNRLHQPSVQALRKEYVLYCLRFEYSRFSEPSLILLLVMRGAFGLFCCLESPFLSGFLSTSWCGRLLFLIICGLFSSAFGSELTIIWYILKLISITFRWTTDQAIFIRVRLESRRQSISHVFHPLWPDSAWLQVDERWTSFHWIQEMI